jgi:hypothetical protein
LGSADAMTLINADRPHRGALEIVLVVVIDDGRAVPGLPPRVNMFGDAPAPAMVGVEPRIAVDRRTWKTNASVATSNRHLRYMIWLAGPGELVKRIKTAWMTTARGTSDTFHLENKLCLLKTPKVEKV